MINHKSKLAFQLAFVFKVLLFALGLIIFVKIIDAKQSVFIGKTSIDNIDVSGLNQQKAKTLLSQKVGQNNDFEITFVYEDISISTPSSSLDFEILIDESIKNAFDQTHKDFNFKHPLTLFTNLFSNKSFSLIVKYDETKLGQIIENVANQIDIEGHRPAVELRYPGNANSLSLEIGKVGMRIDQGQLADQIAQKLRDNTTQDNLNIPIEVNLSFAQLDEKQQQESLDRAKKFVGKEINLKHDDYKALQIKITDQELIKMLHLPIGYEKMIFDQIVSDKNKQIQRDPQNAIFDYEKNENGKITVKNFQPHQDGLAIDETELKNQLTTILEQIESQTPGADHNQNSFTIQTPLKIVEPEITLEKTNDLGIKTLIGFGDSEYDHSIPNRIWNVALTSKKLNNYILAPGEEFRFNQALGDVSQSTGYRPAYVISGGKTILGDGGGVCQVSTTFFRSALDAGLPITKRKAHAYRVSYYELNEKPGIDATVYSGDVDLRFVNDTPGHILIRVSADSEDLYMKVEMYGTDDGRSTEIVDHKTWDLRPAPASAYYDTTDLPPGKIQQIDWAVSGIKASFKNVVKDKDGNIVREEEFYSNYVPWSAKYLRGVAG